MVRVMLQHIIDTGTPCSYLLVFRTRICSGLLAASCVCSCSHVLSGMCWWLWCLSWCLDRVVGSYLLSAFLVASAFFFLSGDFICPVSALVCFAKCLLSQAWVWWWWHFALYVPVVGHPECWQSQSRSLSAGIVWWLLWWCWVLGVLHWCVIVSVGHVSNDDSIVVVILLCPCGRFACGEV